MKLSNIAGRLGINFAVLAVLGAISSGARGQNTIDLNAMTLDLTPVANTTTNGLSGRQFLSTVNDTALIDFTQTANLIRTDAMIAFPDNTQLPPGNAIQWIGKLNLTSGGSYTFGAASDDGSRLFIDGVMVVQNDGAKGVAAGTSTPIDLSAGLHDIRLDYINGVTGAGLTLSYNGPDGSGTIPTTSLFTAETNTLTGASNAVISGAGIGDSLNVSGNSTVSLHGSAFTQVQLGNATFANGSSLSVVTDAGINGKSLRLAGTTSFGAAVTLNLVGDGTNGSNLYLDGALSDGGVASTITKTGSGRLIFDNTTSANSLGASSLIDIQGGSVSLVGSSSVTAFNPIGSAGIRLNGGNLVLESKVGGGRFANAISVVQDGTIQDTANMATTTLSGPLSVAANKTLTLDPIAGGNPTSSLPATLLLSGALSGSGNLSIISSNIGQLANTPLKGVVAVSGDTSGFTGTANVRTGGILQINNAQGAMVNGTIALDGGTLNLFNDGNGSGAPETFAYGSNVVLTNSSTIAVNRTGTAVAPNFPTPANKTIQINNFSPNSFLSTVTNSNGYGLEVTGTTTLANSDQIFNVSTATASNLVQGMTLSGKVTGAGFSVIKTGNGTLALNNAANDFGGPSSFIDIQGGIVAASSDGALGNAGNGVRLDVQGTTGVGFRATGTFATSRTFSLFQSANAVEVTGGNTLTINSPFDLSFGTGNQLVKNDNGVLVLNAANTAGWSASITPVAASGQPAVVQTLTGGVLVNAGIVRILNAGALDQPGNIIAVNTTQGAAVQIGGGITVPNQLVLNTQTSNGYAGGINWGGALQSIGSGVTNTWSGAISEDQDAGITADAGNTLNLTGGITFNAHIVVFGGAGNINVTGSPILTVHSLDKIGSGTTNIRVPTAGPTGNGIRVFAGNLTFSGGGVVSGGGTVQTILEPGGTLNLDNSSAGSVDSRLGGRVMQFLGGNLNLIGGASAVTETIGAPTFNRGESIITITPGAGGANLRFSAASNNVAPAQTTAGTGANVLFRGTNLGAAAGAGNASVAWTAGGLLFNGILTGTNGTNTKAIVPWALIDTSATGLGTSFVTSDVTAANQANTGTAVLRPLASTEYSTATTLTANANMLTTTALSNLAGATINSLTIDTGGSITMATGQTLIASSGGYLVRNGVTSSISGGILAAPAANSPFNIHTVGTAALTISSVLTGGNANSNVGLMKADDGTLTLSTPTSSIAGLSGLSMNTLNMQTVVNRGKLVLNGGTNTLGANNYLEVGNGGTLDLKGTSQYVLGLYTDGIYNGIANAVTSGGTVMNSAAGQATLVTNSDARNWSGQITGNVFYNRTGTITTTTMYAPQTYTGGTLINGGTLSLRDYASLANTPQIDINYASLTADNTQASNITDRINDAAQINLRGGTVTMLGRAQTDSTETVGAISVIEGVNVVDVQQGGTGINSAVLTAASLTRPVGASGVVILGRGASNIDQNGQLGSAPRMLVTAAPALTNNIIGPWAIIRRDWASNIPTLGIGQLNANGFAGYSTGTLTGSPLASDNVKITALNTTTTLTADTTINTLNVTTTSGNTLIDLGGKTLTLAGGGMIFGLDGNTQTHTVNNGTLTSGYANGTKNDLYVYQAAFGGTDRQLVIGAKVADNGATPVRLIVNSGDAAGTANRTTLTGANTYTGGTVVNQGTLAVGVNGIIPSGGITLNGAALTQVGGGVINASNVITLNGPSTVSFVNNNTISGLVFNNNGGGSNAHQVSTFTQGQGVDGTGTLTIGANGIVATSSNVAATSSVIGRLDFGANANTITVDPIMVNGVDVAPLQAGLLLQGITGSAGGITKLGNGTLLLNAQENFTGALNVVAGGIAMGVPSIAPQNTGLAANGAAGSRYSALTLNAGTRMNMLNDATIGSLAGAGTVINVAPSGTIATARTLNVGFDNTSTTFSGSFSRFSDALGAFLQVNKIGSGTMTLTGVSNSTNPLQVSQGGVTFAGAATGLWGTDLVLPTGTLTLDNSGTNVNNRLTGGLGTGGTLTVGGGEFKMIGNSAANTTETIGTLNVGLSAGNLYGNSTITLQANPARSLTLTAGTAFGGIPIGSSGLIRGISGTAGNGLANLNIGALAIGAPANSGSGANGTTTMAIRPDILGDTSATGIGTAFLTKDSGTNFLRPLTAAEMATSFFSGTSNQTVNYGLSSNTSLAGRTIIGSLTLNSGGGVGVDPGVVTAGNVGGLPVGLVVNTGGILSLAGSSTSLNVNRLETQSNAAYQFHTQGDLNVNGVLFGTSGGLNKGDAGTLTLSARNLYTGQTQINNGKLVLNGGDNTLPLLVTAGAPGTTSIGVNAPGATIDLNGTNQITGTLNNNQSQRYAGGGGILTNSSATTTSNYTTISGSAQVFGGSITGNLNFTKATATAGNTLTLSNVNTFTGTTTVRSSTLNLIDAGTLSNTSAVNLFYGALNIDQSGLNPIGNINPVRIPAATPVTLRGGSLTLTSGGSADYSATINTLSVSQSHNTIAVPQAPAGATSEINIGNLVIDPDATLNVTGGTGTTGFFNAAPGMGISNLFIGSINGNAIPATITNKILPANIITNNGEFTTYVSSGTAGSNGQTYGIVTMNGIGSIAQTQYDFNPTVATALPASNPALNVRYGIAGPITLPGNVSYNVMAFRVAGLQLNMNGGTLNLASGGLALTNGTAVVGAFAGDGTVTSGDVQSSGVAPLYIHSTGAIVNSAIADNGFGASTRLVANAISGTLSLAGQNSYTGGTVVNGTGTVAVTTGFIPAGGLTINGATVTTASGGQIAPANDVTINGSGVLTMAGNNTLNSLSFNNIGGTANPAVNIGTSSLTLSATNAITAVNDNVATVPTIAGPLLVLSDSAPVINVSSTARVPTDLTITASIGSTGGAITKTGNGALDLAPASATIANPTTTAGSTTVTVSSSAGMIVGQSFSGVGIPTGTTISAINGNTLTLSLPATGTTGTRSVTTATSTTVTTTDTTGLVVGQTITGTGIPAGATISAITNGTTFTISAAATASGTITATIAVPTGTYFGNTFAGGVNLNAGSLMFGASSTPTTGTAISGPIGSGTLTIGDGTAIMSDSAIRTIANPVVLNGNMTFGTLGGANGSAVAANGVILNGPFDLGGSANRVIDVNSHLNVSTINGIISGAGSSITKTGPGTLALLGANTFDGGVNINGGTLQSSATGMGSTGTISFGGGILQYAAATTTDFSSRFSTANNQPIYIDTNGATVTYASPIVSAVGGSLGKFGAGTLILTNTANYDGATLINAGTLQIGNGALVGALPANTPVLNGGLLLFNRSDALSFFNSMTGAGIVGQAGTNTLTLNGSYAGFGGGVAVDQGTVKFTADANFPGPLLFGSSAGVTTTGTLDLSTLNGTFGGGLTAQTNAAGISTGIIGAGKTLTINGNVNVGYNLGTVAVTATAATNLTLNGGGSLVVTGPTSVVNIGVSQATQLNTATTDVLDVTALSNVNLGTVASPISDVRVAFGQTDAGTLLLSNTANTIAATTLSVGHSNGSNGGVGILTLGAGTNLINADTINIGFSKINGTVAFASQTAGSPGTVTIGNKAGTGGADILVGSQFGTGTGAVLTGTLDLRGHVATVVANNVTVGLSNNNANSGLANGVISMDAGTFNAATLLLGSRINGAAAGTSGTNNTAVLNLGGGTFTVSGATTIANTAITATAGAATGTLNVTGGTFNTGTLIASPKTAAGTGAATTNINVSGGALNVTGATFTLGSQASAGTALASLNITGGVVTSNANILDGGGANTSSVVINGGTLDLAGHTLGGATPIDTLTFAAGGLRNVAQINNGATGLTKTTAGTLVVGGNNAYTGATNVTGGVLSSTGSIAASSGVSVSDPTATFEAAAGQRIKSLTVSAGGARVASAVKVALTVGDGTQAASQLSLTGGKLDLQTNGVVVDYAAGAANDTAALASVRAQLIAGYHPSAPGAGDGKWDGTTGITSSTAAAGSLGAVGYALASDILPFSNGTTDTFLGATVDKSSILARYTLAGDVNLDGSVDFLDLAKLAQSYNVTDGTRQWSTGDVNYDGNTDFLDLAKLAQNYNTALPSSPIPGAPADFQADLARAFASVPEPGTISLLGLGAVALLAGRRRNRRAA